MPGVKNVIVHFIFSNIKNLKLFFKDTFGLYIAK